MINFIINLYFHYYDYVVIIYGMKKKIFFILIFIFITSQYIFSAEIIENERENTSVEIPDPEKKMHYLSFLISVGTPIGKIRDYVKANRLLTAFIEYDIKIDDNSFLNFDIIYFQYENARQQSITQPTETIIHNIPLYGGFKYRFTIDSFKRVFFFLKGSIGFVIRPGKVHFITTNENKTNTIVNFALKPGLDLTFDIKHYFYLSFSYDFQIIFDKEITEFFSFFKFGFGFRF